MFEIICCNKKFINKKSFTNHKRWHNISRYIKFQKRFKIKISFLHKGKKDSQCSIDRQGKRNWMWKGDKVGYKSLHEWIRIHKPKILLCEKCNINPSYDLANINHLYKRIINDYKWWCRSCHMKYDYGKGFRKP